MISTMYCATWVQVTARMPPSSEHTSTPIRPTHTPVARSTPRKRLVMMPAP